MFDDKQLQNIRNAFYKYVDSGEERSRIIRYAESLADGETGADRDAIYWSTIWYCSQPKNREEFKKMYQELEEDGSIVLPEGETEKPKTKPPRKRKGKNG